MDSRFAPGSKTGGLLFAAFQSGKAEPIQWVDLKLGDIVITVAADAMKAPLGDRAGVRLPVSYQETIAICRELDCVAPTQAICDAMFEQAGAQLNFVPLVRTAADSAKLTTVEFALRFHDGVEKQLSQAKQDRGLVAGAWKYWILHPRLAERGAVNYGFWDKSKKPPRPVQTVGGRHDATHYDYSQLLQPVKRFARCARTGKDIDLLAHIESSDRVPGSFLSPYNRQSSVPRSFVLKASSPVDVLQMLGSAGVDVAPVEGWEERGRPGFTPEGVMVHHTAGPRTGDAPSLSVCINGRPGLSGPLCHIVLARSGKAHLIAANIANHAGTGSQQVLDLVRRDEAVTGNARERSGAAATPGNQFFYGIEVENSGLAGDPYPPGQIEALARICATLCLGHGWSANRVVHHRQWTSRKIDMSWRGDLTAMIAQYMDADMAAHGVGEDSSEPAWEPEHSVEGMNCCESDCP